MTDSITGNVADQGIAASLAAEGFAYVPAARLRPVLEAAGMQDWAGFAASWDDLGLDTYMADGGRYRKRRHAVFRVLGRITGEAVERRPHQPHYQSRDYNALNGGIARWFEPVTEAAAASPALRAILATCADLFDGLDPAPAWHVELHQFRIEARAGAEGRPTPEGMHQDGVDWVLVLLVARENVAEGETRIAGPDKAPLGSFTLAEPMDAAFVDDHRVFHGVTPVVPVDPARPAHRDVLVVTFRREA
jgi:hypothetical protein